MSKDLSDESNIHITIGNRGNNYIDKYPIMETQFLRFSDDHRQVLRCTIGEPYKGYIIEAEFVDSVMYGPASIFTNQGVIVAMLQLVDGKREGLCYEYSKEGRLLFEGYYKNDRRHGIGKSYFNGQVIKYGRYDCGKCVTIYSIYPKQGYMEERDVSNKLIALSQLDSSFQRHGICYLYQNERIQSIVKYEKGEAMHCLRSFEGNQMSIFDVNCMLIYSGSYLDDIEMNFPRDGQGNEYGTMGLIYSGDFNRDIKQGKGKFYSKGVLRFDGEWEGNAPNGEGCYFDEYGKEVASGKWEYGYYHVEGKKWLDYESGQIEKVRDKKYLKHWRKRGGEYVSDLSIFCHRMGDGIKKMCMEMNRWLL